MHVDHVRSQDTKWNDIGSILSHREGEDDIIEWKLENYE